MESGRRTCGLMMCTRNVRDSVHRCGVVVVCILLALTRTSDSANAYVWSNTKKPTSDITCWTCNEKANNEDCNNWAPDLKCPVNHTVCETVHRFSTPGMTSLQVTKRCVQTTECSPRHVGCSQPDPDSGQQECISCCDSSYCNQEVPVNHSTALQLSSFTRVPVSAAWTLRPVGLGLVLCVLTSLLWSFSDHRLWDSLLRTS